MVILRTDSARQTSRAKKLRKLGSETPAFESHIIYKYIENYLFLFVQCTVYAGEPCITA